MGTYHDFLQRAIVFATAMILALVYGTLDATVCTALMIHSVSPLEFDDSSLGPLFSHREPDCIMSRREDFIRGKV